MTASEENAQPSPNNRKNESCPNVLKWYIPRVARAPQLTNRGNTLVCTPWKVAMDVNLLPGVTVNSALTLSCFGPDANMKAPNTARLPPII